MKILVSFIKIVFLMSMITCRASAIAYNFDAQQNDNLEIIVNIGFKKNSKLTFTNDTVNIILDPRFDPSSGKDVKTRHAKTFLYQTIQMAIIEFGAQDDLITTQQEKFLAQFQQAFKINNGPLEINIQKINYQLNLYPNLEQVTHSGKILSDSIQTILKSKQS